MAIVLYGCFSERIIFIDEIRKEGRIKSPTLNAGGLNYV
jgi:hypothetical protein